MDFKNIKKKVREPKVSQDFCQMFVISKKKTDPKDMDLKNLQKIYRLAYGFLFFVIFISGKGLIGITGSSVSPSPILSPNNQPNVGRGRVRRVLHIYDL
jgi:hypothetical protein